MDAETDETEQRLAMAIWAAELTDGSLVSAFTSNRVPSHEQLAGGAEGRVFAALRHSYS